MAQISRRQSRPIVCLHADDHDDNVDDYFTHYFGCIRIADRGTYFDNTPPDGQQTICTELRRVSYLLGALASGDTSPEDKALVTNVRSSLKGWREANIKSFRDAKRDPNEINRDTSNLHDPNKGPPKRPEPYHPDRDIKAYAIFFEGGSKYDYVEGQKDERICHGLFPNQKLTVHDLLRHKRSPLRKSDTAPDPGRGRVRYFHLPSNNMKVSTFDRSARYIGALTVLATSGFRYSDQSSASPGAYND
jgi:hypothetical protein